MVGMEQAAFKKALIFLSIGLEPIIFAVVGWYAAPYIGLGDTVGALVGVVVGFALMFWNIWRLGLSVELRAKYDVESESLRGLTSYIELERYRVTRKSDLVKVMGTSSYLQLLNVLKEVGLIDKKFYEVDRLSEELERLKDFSQVMAEVRVRAPLEFIKVLDGLSDFFTLLSLSFALKYEVEGDVAAKCYVVPPFKLDILSPRRLVETSLEPLLANHRVREHYSKALEEALSRGTRRPILALAAYSLALASMELERLSYGRAYSDKLKELSQRLFSASLAGGEDLQTLEMLKLAYPKLKSVGSSKLLEEVDERAALKSFIDESYKLLMSSGRLRRKAEVAVSYLFVKWGEKVNLNLALAAFNKEMDVREAYALMFFPF